MEMSKEQEVQYIEDMIVNLKKAITNASQFGDTLTIEAINKQIMAMQKRLRKIKEI